MTAPGTAPADGQARTPGQAAWEAYCENAPGEFLVPPGRWNHKNELHRAAWEAAAKAAIKAQPTFTPEQVGLVAGTVAGQIARERDQARAELAGLCKRLDGLMPMGLYFDDADPVARCLVGDCKWHAHGDAMVDATTAWARHLAADHQRDWPDDEDRAPATASPDGGSGHVCKPGAGGCLVDAHLGDDSGRDSER